MTTPTVTLHCNNTGTDISVAQGSSLYQLSTELRDNLGFDPICVRVNNKTEPLSYRVYNPKIIEMLPPTHDSGNRAYVRSLCMMLYCAIRRLYPGAKLKMMHSISHGYFCRVIGLETTEDTVRAIEAEMRRLHQADIPFVLHEAPTAQVIELFKAQGLDDKVRLLTTIHDLYTKYYTLGDIADSYYGCLAPSTGHIGVFALTTYKDGMLLRSLDPFNPTQTPEPIVQDKMFKAFTDYLDFNRILGVSNVGELNRVAAEGRTRDLINVAEALHQKYISAIADEITRRHRQGGARIILIAGPSSSGKTTTTKRLAIQLMTNLLRPVMISLDNYFVDRAHTPRDADGEYDYESLYALDLATFNSDLQDLLDGKEVGLPTYDFATGTRKYKGNKISLGADSVILIEGIHGLNPELTPSIAESDKFRIYVSALTTLTIDDHNWVPTTDNRLLRRIVRDYKYRNIGAAETIRRWPSVRRGEEKWIFPYQENADATFNSSLLFELGVIRQYACEILGEVSCDQPEYAQAYRLRKFLSYFPQIDNRTLPPTSLLREFLGGSSFHY